MDGQYMVPELNLRVTTLWHSSKPEVCFLMDLPAADEFGKMEAVKSIVGQCLIDFQSFIKAQLFESCTADSDIHNVGDLTLTLIQSTQLQPTLQLFIRVAFLRWHVTQYPKLAENSWWPRVDTTLDNLRTTFRTEADINNQLLIKYQNDKKQYGDPASSACRPVAVANISVWQRTIGLHAARCEKGQAGSVKRRKRKNTELS
ncbi:hypothetical protein HGRIS_003383 [Hohenbuehelia grisea]|uniref:Uncharacterized protein n=1 Tax=Hohenbuehelia grisea TaxID=104357 RepID=A0ABR3JFH3_9AGAR